MKPAKPMLWVGRPAKPEKAVLLAKAACESKIILEVCGPYTLQGVLGADRETLLDEELVLRHARRQVFWQNTESRP